MAYGQNAHSCDPSSKPSQFWYNVYSLRSSWKVKTPVIKPEFLLVRGIYTRMNEVCVGDLVFSCTATFIVILAEFKLHVHLLKYAVGLTLYCK